MEDMWEKLTVLGLNAILNDKNQEDFKNLLLNKYLELIEPRLIFLDTNFQMQVVMGLLGQNPEIFKEEFWIKYIDQVLASFEHASHQYIHANGAWFVLINRIKDLSSKVDWYQVLIRLSQATVEVGSRAHGFNTVLGWLVAADKHNLINLMHRSETKHYPKDLKIELYRQIVKLGMLDNKLARRIRSDTNGTLSTKILAFLFENRNTYSEDDFKELIGQFSDTKHKWVARFIALNMPMSLVPFLMGLQDSLAVKILEKRLNALET